MRVVAANLHVNGRPQRRGKRAKEVRHHFAVIYTLLAETGLQMSNGDALKSTATRASDSSRGAVKPKRASPRLFPKPYAKFAQRQSTIFNGVMPVNRKIAFIWSKPETARVGLSDTACDQKKPIPVSI